jgi:hypothetical protein
MDMKPGLSLWEKMRIEGVGENIWAQEGWTESGMEETT